MPRRDDDPKTRDAAERHRTHPDPPIQGQTTHRQLVDTDGEGGVGGTTDGLYERPAGTGPSSPRRSPREDGELDYDRAHAELGDGSADFTSERAEQVLETDRGDPEVTESLTSSGVMEENVDLAADTVAPLDERAPRRPAAENRKDPRKPPDSAIQKP
ncbi:MAG TPA: hypothetical protein VFO11_14015 [Candidatus Polarisedimenticolaceae bacterium]|nr:hypothetical protein [Candidatus Polarisedimenticolaceae bacterium]